MRRLLLMLSLVSLNSAKAQFTFNFSTGKSAYWSNPGNWEGGVVPPVSVSSIQVLPPDDSEGWLCIMDADGVTCTSKLVVSRQASLLVLPGKKLYCGDSIRIDSKASFMVEGELKLLCPIRILNNGCFTINASGSVKFNDPFTCTDDPSRFINNGPLYVNGALSFDGSYLECHNIFRNKGLVQLYDKSHISCDGDVFNDGTITGGIIFSASRLTNYGAIELSGTGDHAVSFSCKDYLVNHGSIKTDANMYLKGTVLNYNALGSLYPDPANCNLDTVQFFNYGSFLLAEGGTARFIGSVYNSGTFDFHELFDPLEVDLAIINDGQFNGCTTWFSKGTVINNNSMNLYAYTDSNRIQVPFINIGTLTSTGPIKLNNAFINRGQLVIQ